MRCKLCDNKLRGPVVGKFFACDSCQIYYNTVIPSKVDLKRSLAGMMLSACFSPKKTQMRINNAIEQLEKIDQYVSVGRLYDVGAAGGFVMKAARDRGWEVFGNELSRRAVEWAKQKFKIDIFHGFLEDDPKAMPNNFDLIIFWNTLEHMRNPVEEMEIAVQMLKPGGHIHIRVPIKNEEEMHKFHVRAHMVEFRHKSLDILLDKFGLQEITRMPFTGSKVRCTDLLWRRP